MSVWMNPPEFESAQSQDISYWSSFFLHLITSASVQSLSIYLWSVSVCLQFCPLAIHLSYCCLGLVCWQFFTDFSCLAHKTPSDPSIVFITIPLSCNWHAITYLFGVLEQTVLFFIILGLKSVFSMLFPLAPSPPHTHASSHTAMESPFGKPISSSEMSMFHLHSFVWPS